MERLIQIPDWIDEGLYRCRVRYTTDIEKIEFYEYRFNHPEIIEIVEDTSIVYPYKFEDRRQFHLALAEHPHANEVIITHNGYLTDSSFSNIALFDGNNWLTPDTPLLNGTKRQYLLDNKILKEAPIQVEDLRHFKKLSLINAMRDLNIVYDFIFYPNHLIIHGKY
ncbi:aminotransferase class IV [Emticicia sp. BO119]|uniref:aminotransferase class IV n=1 Tax=Emticicia sp. BO119 TaxID=2757768 RepID=UPI0015F0E5F6|nr:aminotransferase class IV [Emticicia sp. BO119]MBA4849956.1 aminotransferase class IV [Emticicia sp. BO119]